ncbi:HlyD family type I secretion periplasmic adaptor subunit [Thiopseudomonas denitrificans]|nr:HlyD family type I secretion periplasmic adaptor subunit [Thiopseudomonas denitrificans]
MSKETSQLTAVKLLLLRYWQVFINVWAIRDKLDPPKRKDDELAFLPAHLELVETPVSVAPKWTARLIILFVFFALIWSVFSEVDVVATGQGKIIISGYSKTIQPLENSVVSAVYVRNGQDVKKGEPLIRLTAIGSESDLEQARTSLKSAYLAKWRGENLVKILEIKDISNIGTFMHPRDLVVTSDEIDESKNLLLNQFLTWQYKDQQLDLLMQQRNAEINTIKTQQQKAKSLLEIEQGKLENLGDLYESRFITEHSYLEQKATVLQLEADVKTNYSKVTEIEKSIAQTHEERMTNTQALISETLDSIRQANESINQASFEVEKNQQRNNLMLLTSPVDGTVQQLETHTINGVVTTAQPLMVIVPKEDFFEVDVLIQNKDIGFVRKGQGVIIKLDAFPYTRHGYLTGTIKSISYDAIEDEKMGLVYSSLISLDKQRLNGSIKLTAGLSVVAEINTDKRTVIDYLLSPLKTKIDTSFRER